MVEFVWAKMLYLALRTSHATWEKEDGYFSFFSPQLRLIMVQTIFLILLVAY